MRRRWGGASAVLVAAALVAGCGGDGGSAAADDGEGHPWMSARLSQDQQSLTIHALGMAPWVEGDPCTMAISAVATETDEQVTVSVAARRPPNPFDQELVTCDLAGNTHTETVALEQPLGDRRVVDGHDGRINEVRDARGGCVQAAVRPDPEPVDPPVSATELPPDSRPDDGC